jgi:uncharacterized protein with PIN domain
VEESERNIRTTAFIRLADVQIIDFTAEHARLALDAYGRFEKA